MKKQIKIKVAFLILLTGLAFSCKKNESTTIDSYENDSIQNTIDTVGPEVDTINMDTTVTVKADTITK
ncbi:hypothetical protein [Flavobacterium tyrosinilyticum]|uniref:hypothetical protein n=1 Tax=Flavobacterium tyrosinilyticum TaxID=1658740 RepID=UPI00202DD20C|nr:hypothetical protein [Flavobacterium tyrosinilyticum]MCM0668080.1 hypothetical protein [Flavobacterium tyrosinilyticum]